MSNPLYEYNAGRFDAALAASVTHISPALMLSYLAGRDWVFLGDVHEGAGVRWGLFKDGRLEASVMIPLAPVANFDKRLQEAIAVVSSVEQWPATASFTLPAQLRPQAIETFREADDDEDE